LGRSVADSALVRSKIPLVGSDWEHEVIDFALTFNGYEYWGSFDRCAEVARRCLRIHEQTGNLPETLTELRTCLFWLQRADRWNSQSDGYDQPKEEKRFIPELLEAVRRISRTSNNQG
jgi:hypothetical protein